MQGDMIVLPPWRYDFLEKAGYDMSNYTKVEYPREAEPERIVTYTNREARRAAARARRRS